LLRPAKKNHNPPPPSVESPTLESLSISFMPRRRSSQPLPPVTLRPPLPAILHQSRSVVDPPAAVGCPPSAASGRPPHATADQDGGGDDGRELWRGILSVLDQATLWLWEAADRVQRQQEGRPQAINRGKLPLHHTVVRSWWTATRAWWISSTTRCASSARSTTATSSGSTRCGLTVTPACPTSSPRSAS
jgi:hypothetical protein